MLLWKRQETMDDRDVDNLSPHDWAKVRRVIDFILSHPKSEESSQPAPEPVENRQSRTKSAKKRRADSGCIQLELELTETTE